MSISFHSARWLIRMTLLGCAAAITIVRPAIATSDSLPGVRVLAETSFEPGQPSFSSAHHHVVSTTGRTGQCSLMAEVTAANQARFFEIPFKASKGKVVRVSYWVVSDRKSACATFARVGQDRVRIGPKINSIPVRKWVKAEGAYEATSDVSGVIQIAAPSSFDAPAGKVWVDDVLVVEAENECQWPPDVQDFPALASAGSGQVYLAALERPAGECLIRIFRVQGTKRDKLCMLKPENATGIGAPAMAGLDDGCVVAFPVEQNKHWRIAYAFVDDNTAGSVTCRYLDGEGLANISPALAVANGRVCVVWESNAGNTRGIYACSLSRHEAGGIRRLSSDNANSYNPALVAGADGSMFAAWDSVRDDGADLYGAWWRDGQWCPEQRITSHARIERHPALAAWKNEIWIAWQAQSYGHRHVNSVTEQRIVVARIGQKGLSCPQEWFDRVSSPDRLLLRPRILFDQAGRLWVTARESMGQHAGWRPVAWCYEGSTWSDRQPLMYQQGRWRPVSMTLGTTGLLAACQYDNVADQGGHAGKDLEWRSGIAVRLLCGPQSSSQRALLVKPLAMPDTEFSLAEKIQLCSARLPRQSVWHKQKSLTLFWGDLHDHTDLSICARNWNPPGHDLFANERDIERLDFCALTDHGFDFDTALWAYNGEQTRNNHDPGRFLTFLAQEWTSSKNPPAVAGQPNRYGHHNLIYLDPFYNRWHDSWDGDISPADLWRQLEGIEFICIPHQLADWQHKGKGNPPTDWNYINEKLQPLAEIFQNRQSYEYLGCPRQAKHGAPFEGYYLQDAWAKGIIIGTIASPDHGGGGGKVGVWAEKLTRESVFRSLQSRHTFGTSGAKISLCFRAGDALMGDKVKRPDGAVTFRVEATAMHDFRELVIFRNNKIVHREIPGTPTLAIEWTDPDPPAEGLLWYYARVFCEDEELAWSSPIWFEP